MRSDGNNRLNTLQMFRTIAATMVITLHAVAIVKYDTSGFIEHKFGFGVDLFFVISGFIMVYASCELFGKDGSWKIFLVYRLIRIVPLYWFATTLRVISLATIAQVSAKTFPSMTAIITSYLFYPFDTMGFGDQYPFPILDVGWTLNFELFFYLVFAACISLRVKLAVIACTVFLLAGVLVNGVVPLALPAGFWFRPIVLEFVMGMWIGLAYLQGGRIGVKIAGPLLVLGVLALVFVELSSFSAERGPGNYSFGRFLLFGSVAGAWVAAGTLCSRMSGAGFRLLVGLGDSSYALYLLHPFVFLVFKAIFARIDPSEFEIAAITVMIFSAVIVAHGFHLFVEKRITRRLREIFGRLVAKTDPA